MKNRSFCLRIAGVLWLAMVCFVATGAPVDSKMEKQHTRKQRVKESRYKCKGRMLTRAQIASSRGISVKQLDKILSANILTSEEVCTVSSLVLQEAQSKAMRPIPTYGEEAMKYRLLALEDENGHIPEDGLERARLHTLRMREDYRRRHHGRKASMAGVVADSEAAFAAGIEPNQWTSIGPGNIGGRVRSLVIHPTSPSTMWLGSVTGGIWKTTNGGTSWAPVDDFMANLAVGSMVMQPGSPSILYAGTGESYGNWRGAGIFKSTDGGETWVQLPSTANSSFHYVNRLAFSPNGSTLLAATNTGIWRSLDGGATWSQRTPTRTLDVDFHPTNNLQAIAGRENGTTLYSLDGGNSWTTATVFGNGRVETSYAKSNPTIVYASVAVNGGEIWRSTNSGQSYTRVSTGTNYGGAYWQHLLWVDPTNSNTLIAGGVDLYRSTNGGASFTKISQWQSAPTSAHADHHAAVVHPQYDGVNNRTVFFVNDGGIYKTSNVHTVSSLSGWQELNNTLGITQFYGAAGNVASGTIVGGTQDNGTPRYRPSSGSEGWTTMFGGDGGFCAADPTDSNYFYGEYIYLTIHRSTNGGTSASYIYNGITDASNSCANFIAPFILDPNNPNTLLGGGCRLWRSTNVKASTPAWSSIKAALSGNSPISAIAVAKGNSSIIWAGHNNGDVYKSTNGTATSPTWTLQGASPLPNRKVTRITVNPSNHNVVYVTFGGFSADNVWRTSDGGATWVDVTGTGGTGLPDAPVRSLVIHPNNGNWLYVGTEVGIFASEDGGQSWAVPHDGPANVSVDELFWMGTTLVAATHGRGLYSVPVSGVGCSYTISPTSASYGASASSGSVSVTAGSGCSWSASSNASWLSITSGSSGSGNGAVGYSVAANSGSSSRTGTLTVAGQTFTVSQAGSGGGGTALTNGVGIAVSPDYSRRSRK